MFSDLAARMAPRRRGLASGSPPPFLAAILISLIRRVKILPRLASSSPVRGDHGSLGLPGIRRRNEIISFPEGLGDSKAFSRKSWPPPCEGSKKEVSHPDMHFCAYFCV